MMSSSTSSSAANPPPTKVSFTVRRPTPISRQGSSGLDSDHESTFKVSALPRHLTESGRSTPASPLANGKTKRQVNVEHDSSDDKEEDVDEIVTGFDQFGVQRLKEKKKADDSPLVIPALANKDWREIARKRKAAEMYVPAGGAAKTGADGSVGGLGTKDSINSGPVVAGLIKMEKRMRMDEDESDAQISTSFEATEVHQETEDDVAMRALISKANGETDTDSGLTIGTIPAGEDVWRPGDETEAYRRDVVTRPDQASLEDYARIPVEQFGAALLRGMGWKPGQAASRTRKGVVEPYLPTARPALLGIGAKEREAVDDGSKSKKPARPERRYIPVVKKEREGSGKDSGTSSRRSSGSPGPDRRREKDRDSPGERSRTGEKDRDRDYDRRRDRDRDYTSSRDYKERRGDKEYESSRNSGRGSDRGGRRDDDRKRDKDRDYDRRR